MPECQSVRNLCMISVHLWRGRVAVQVRDQHGLKIKLAWGRNGVYVRACDTSMYMYVKLYITRVLVEFGFHI